MRNLGIPSILALSATFALGACSSGETRKEEQVPETQAAAGSNEEGRAGHGEVVGRTSDIPGLEEVQSAPGIVPYEEQLTVVQRRSLPTVVETRVKADINRMEAEHFVALGLPRETAEIIVEFREQNGMFRSVEELKQVQGIDVAWVDRNRDRLGTSQQRG